MSKRKPKKKVRNVVAVGLPGGPRTLSEALAQAQPGDMIVCPVGSNVMRGET